MSSSRKSSKACALCRRHKIKCIGGLPCRRCLETDTECVPQSSQSVPLPERVAKLERELQRLRELVVGNHKQVEAWRDGKEQGIPANRNRERSNSEERGNGSVSSRSSPDAGAEVDIEEDELLQFESVRLNKRILSDVRPPRSKRLRQTFSRKFSDEDSSNSMEMVAFNIFQTRCSHMFPFLDTQHPLEYAQLRSQNNLFYWSIIAVGSREATELVVIHRLAERKAAELSRETLFGRRPTLEDLKGLIIMWTWLSEAQSPGHVVAVAHELRLRHLCVQLYRSWKTHLQRGLLFTDGDRLSQALRLYASLLTMDALASAVSSRPRLLPLGDMVEQCSFLLLGQDVSSLRAAAQVEIVDIMTEVQTGQFVDYTHPDPLSDSQVESLIVLNRRAGEWQTRWSSIIPATSNEGYHRLRNSITFIHLMVRFTMNCLPLRGASKSLGFTPDSSSYISVAVDHARSVARFVTKTYLPPAINYTSNFTQLQLAHAALFLIRITGMSPGVYDTSAIRDEVMGLAGLLSEIAGGYYAKIIYTALAAQNQIVGPLQHTQVADLRGTVGTAQENSFGLGVDDLGSLEWDLELGSWNWFE